MTGNIVNLVKDAVKKHHAATTALSDDLAAHPELSGAEFESSQKIVELLRKHGCEVEYPYFGYDTAFRAKLGSGGGVPAAAIMVE